MKKIFALLLILSAMCLPSYASFPDKDIMILYTNDVHCAVDENLGYAGVVYCVNEAKKLTPYVALVDAGDFSQGGTIGTISQGRYLVEIMNAVSYDVVIPGNHEFGYGWGMFENFSRNLKCGFISCNLRDLRTGKLLFSPYKIFTYGNTKVAFVGVTTPESIVKTTPSSFMDENGKYIYDFDGDTTGEKLIASIQSAADSARAEGADYVIVVAHLGEYEDVTEVWSTPYIAPRTRGIDVFIDGHSHEITPAMVVKNSDGKDVIITQTGTKLNNVGRLTISTEGKITTELLNGFDGRDESTVKIVDGIKARFADTLKQHLTFTSFDLRAMDDKGDWLIRASETNLCNLITDALLASARETKTGKADIAFINAGAIRDNIKPGEITYSDALNVLPFVNTVCICDVPGQTILDELEMGARLLPGNGGGFLHVAGMTYTVDATIPTPVKLDGHNTMTGIEGQRRVRDVFVNGEPLDPEKVYKVVSLDYVLREGGDGHVFRGARMIEPDYATTTDAFAHYMKDFERLPESYRNAQGRITFLK